MAKNSSSKPKTCYRIMTPDPKRISGRSAEETACRVASAEVEKKHAVQATYRLIFQAERLLRRGLKPYFRGQIRVFPNAKA